MIAAGVSSFPGSPAAKAVRAYGQLFSAAGLPPILAAGTSRSPAAHAAEVMQAQNR